MMMFKEVWNLCCLRFSREYQFYSGSSTNLESICSFTKLIDKKLERCPCTMKKVKHTLMQMYNVVIKFKTNLKIIGFNI